MANIHFSLSGEGRGHAARAQVLVDLLRKHHQVTLHAYGAALSMLRPLYQGTEIEVREIPGMRFAYDNNGTLNRPLSLICALPFVSKIPIRVRRYAAMLVKEKVDLVIADFEPLLCRAAALAGIPLMSVDHQQFLTCYDLSSLSQSLRRKADSLAPFVRAYYPRLNRAVISAFFFPPLKQEAKKHPITQTGVLLRREILEASPEVHSQLVAYVRRQAPSTILDALSASGRTVHVYGHGAHESRGNLHFHEINPSRFAEHLTHSDALISSAGNQVVGEALSLRKPVLAYPEPGNFEQHVNGHFLEASGQGWSREAQHFSPELLRDFLSQTDELRDRIRPERLNGNRPTLVAVEYEIAAAALKTGRASDPVGYLTRPFAWRPGGLSPDKPQLP